MKLKNVGKEVSDVVKTYDEIEFAMDIAQDFLRSDDKVSRESVVRAIKDKCPNASFELICMVLDKTESQIKIHNKLTHGGNKNYGWNSKLEEGRNLLIRSRKKSL